MPTYITDYAFIHEHNDDYKATYILHIPAEHFANGTKEEILQQIECRLSFYDVPFLYMRSRLISIVKPERFGKWDTHEERVQYLHNFVHDSTLKTNG